MYYRAAVYVVTATVCAEVVWFLTKVAFFWGLFVIFT
jgi:hypothetical protein